MRDLPVFFLKTKNEPVFAVQHKGEIIVNLLKGTIYLKEEGERTQIIPIASDKLSCDVNDGGILPLVQKGVKFIVHEKIYRDNPTRKDLLLPQITESFQSNLFSDEIPTIFTVSFLR